MTPRRTPLERLKDIEAHAVKAREFLGDATLEDLNGDDKTFFAIIRALEVVGEATKHVPQDVRDLAPSVPWRQIAGMRDRVAHDYMTIRREIIRNAVTDDIPPLLVEVRRLIAELSAAAPPDPPP